MTSEQKQYFMLGYMTAVADNVRKLKCYNGVSKTEIIEELTAQAIERLHTKEREEILCKECIHLKETQACAVTKEKAVWTSKATGCSFYTREG